MNKKKCIKCKKELSIDYFNFRSDTKKFRGVCKICSKGVKEPIKIKQERIQNLLSNGKKECGKCQKIKPLDDFCVDKHTVTGRASNCRSCVKTAHATQAHKDKSYVRRLKSLYKLTDYEINSFMSLDSCQICGLPFNDKRIKSCDHDHDTGSYRGALCRDCNIGLGLFYDNKESLLAAVKYLDK